MHCESFFSAAYPAGDKGGNDFYVRPATRGVRLHGIWDGLLGSAINPRTQWNYAIELDAKFPRTALPELAAHTTSKEWSLESRQLAIQYGYLNGNLRGGMSESTAPALPADYTKQAKTVAERQGAMAGYRLADEIRKYLKYDGVVPPLSENPAVATAESPIPSIIGTAEASRHYDESMVVTGKVVQITIRPTVTFVDLDGSGRNSPFTAVIFPDNVGKFGDLQRFKNQDVEISGTITQYRNKLEIVLESPDQIKSMDGK